MIPGRNLGQMFQSSLRRLPADLAAVVVVTLLTFVVMFGPIVNETSLRAILGLVFVLFVPGYAFVAALFPESGSGPIDTVEDESVGSQVADGETTSDDGGWLNGRIGIDGVERAALSFGLSIAIVPTIGFLLSFTPWGIEFVPIVTAIALFTLLCTAIAAKRRWNLAPEDRFSVPYRRWTDAARSGLFDRDNRVDAALNVALALAILLALGSVTYAVAAPPQGEEYTDFHVLTENDNGELVADGYPGEMSLDESADIVVGVSNSEQSVEEYTVVVILQEVDIVDTETHVQEQDELTRFYLALEHDETHHHEHSLEPTMTGEELRVVYLLYKGDAPAEPTRDNAYRDLFFWIDVEEPEG